MKSPFPFPKAISNNEMLTFLYKNGRQDLAPLWRFAVKAGWQLNLLIYVNEFSFVWYSDNEDRFICETYFPTRRVSLFNALDAFLTVYEKEQQDRAPYKITI